MIEMNEKSVNFRKFIEGGRKNLRIVLKRVGREKVVKNLYVNFNEKLIVVEKRLKRREVIKE